MSGPGRKTMVLGMAIGAAAGLVFGAPVAFVVRRQLSQPTVEAWRPVPVVVAAHDLRPGHVMTMETISQRFVPACFVSAGYVKADSASFVVNQQVLTPIEAGAPVSYWMVEAIRTTAPAEVPQAPPCSETVRAFSGDAGTPELERLIDALERQARGP